MGQTDELTLITSFRRRGTTIIALFAVLSAIVVSALVYNMVIGGFADMVARSVGSFVSNALEGSETLSPLDAASLGRLDEHTSVQIKTGNFTIIRLMEPDGTIVYSTMDGEVGTTLEIDRGMEKALTGTVASEHLGMDGGRYTRRIEAPIRLTEGGPVVGVMEIHKRYESVWRGALRSAFTIAVVVLVGGLIAISLLHVVTYRAEKAVLATQNWALSLNQRLRDVTADREAGYLGTIEALSTAVNIKDSYTALHSLNVATYARAVAEYAGWAEDVDMIERAGLVHDIGKIGIAESILRKPGRLTDDERTIVQEHSAAGAEILARVPFLYDVVSTVRHHHERWDGKGYPDGLAGEDIPRTARLMAVVDAYDAMTTDRPYRHPLAVHDALVEIVAHRGTQFDPECVDLFLAAHAEGRIQVGVAASAPAAGAEAVAAAS